MSDLISRQVVLDELNNEDSPYFIDITIQDGDTNKEIIEKTLNAYRKILVQMMNDIPTAYNVDKVMWQLEKCKQAYPFGTWFDMVEEAMSIVHGGISQ